MACELVPSGEAELPPEIAFLSAADGVAAETLREAARLALREGVGADQALIRHGMLDEERYYRALARHLGLPFAAADLPVDSRARFPDAVLSGLAPLDRRDGSRRWAAAPTGAVLGRCLDNAGKIASGIAITTPARLRSAVLAAKADQVARLAAEGLPRRAAHLSYHGGSTPGQVAAAILAGLVFGLCCGLVPEETWRAATLVFGAMFLLSTAPRLAAAFEPIPTEPAKPLRRTPDRSLPVYTIIVPLFREARVLPKLVRALEALDYPRSKLDILLVLEAEDDETRAALAGTRLPPHMAVVVAPDGQPRTKPRALNVALALARGEHTVIYDAEDVPDPNQLRLAAAIFAAAAPEVACLQARLAIDNTGDGWLPRLFTVEYAALFDVINPALIRYDLPLTLGGTSNHFRTAILQDLGGWDAWNVTEDADLGLRLAKAGFRVGDLPSTTLEEAPRRLSAWMRQRTRWMKGFLQVAIVHSRRPLEDLRLLGLIRYAGAGFVTVGVVLSAVVFPFLVVLAGHQIATGDWLRATGAGDVAAAAIGSIVFCAGLAALLLPPAVALVRRRWWGLLYLVPLMPLYFALVSVAAWRGVLELLLAPDRWNKTEHGLARTSRAALARAAAGGPPLPPPEDARR